MFGVSNPSRYGECVTTHPSKARAITAWHSVMPRNAQVHFELGAYNQELLWKVPGLPAGAKPSR